MGELREVSGRAERPPVVTVAVGGLVAVEYPTPLAAAVGLLGLIPTDQLGGLRWLDLVRAEKRRRMAAEEV